MKILYAIGAVLLSGACMPSGSQAVAGNPATLATVAPPSSPQPVSVADSLANRPEVQTFIAEMVRKHGFDPQVLNTIFSQAQFQPDIIAAISRPAEAKPWHAYRKIFLVPKRIRGGVEFWNAHAPTLARAEQVYGVPAEIIVAILGVETLYGGNTGKHRVLEALSTLAFDYPRRADFFRRELEQYLLLAREEGIDPLSLQGSYAGAMGLAQFMPSSYRAYAVDFSGNGQRDLWTNPQDAIGSIANYLSVHGWTEGEVIVEPATVRGGQYQSLLSKELKPKLTVQQLRQQGVIPQTSISGEKKAILLELEGEGGPEHWLGFNNFYVITRYNHSPLYAMAVYQLGQEIRRQR